jgi:hypothetical protein
MVAALRGARNFVRRVAGSLGEAPQKLNPVNCRVRAKKKVAPGSAIK